MNDIQVLEAQQELDRAKQAFRTLWDATYGFLVSKGVFEDGTPMTGQFLIRALEDYSKRPSSLEDFRSWCIDKSASPNDKYMQTWEIIDRYNGDPLIRVGSVTTCKN